MTRTYDFATIGFRPYTETEEFVTIGVVALDSAARHCGKSPLTRSAAEPPIQAG